LQNNKNIVNDKQYKILLVDDEQDITFTFSIALEENGFKVDAFNDPLLALSSFKQGFYNLALLDMKMPKMNGFELCKELRKIDEKLKISFITAFDIRKEDLKIATLTLNENDLLIIRKPILLDELVSSVKAELK
jgi:DNA-binding response OmpR family regulator